MTKQANEIVKGIKGATVLMDEALEIMAGEITIETNKKTFGEHFVAFARLYIRGKTFDIGRSPRQRDERVKATDENDLQGWLGDLYKAEQGIKDKPDCWKQYKSNIAKLFLEFNILPSQYENMGGANEMLQNKRKQKAGNDVKASAKALSKGVNVEQAASDIANDPQLAGILSAIASEFVQLDDEHKDKMVADLIGIHDRYKKVLEKVVPITPEKDGDTKKVVNH